MQAVKQFSNRVVTYFPWMSIGKRVRELREGKQLSQAALAKSAGITQPALSFIERGITADPGAHLTYVLAQKLGVETDYLVSGTDRTDLKMLSPEVLKLALQLQQLSPDKLAAIAATVQAFTPPPPPPDPNKH